MANQLENKESVVWSKEEKIQDLGDLAELIMARHGGAIINAEILEVESKIAQICNKYGLQHPDLDSENECRALRDKARILIEDLQSEPDHG
ncbi:MAG: hypothetical protein AAB590_01140 [Patescibacteria group bacterium]